LQKPLHFCVCAMWKTWQVRDHYISTTMLICRGSNYNFRTGVGNLWPAGQMQPMWTFDMACIIYFVTQFRVQHCV